ncbi:PQQ-dependent sugar dehydrogenase [Christiangramia flava]|uniref:PQQ-dependent oxidoreductase, gdhB family n=1 Tax=Christiangramia flava JLT2011 TaxID=1229726 RepID=A0A1L7I717_9FLAO|nr:PQQ-dependent sugar dehydrogenase [Christiangramia flava]APU69399.1 PQQ-dependent oxidoreductase, gdhB family [Christiangramia flava JLT2011]OSS37722.1 PQQ-dependent oxidoreductase, gdhB family [Christiangramia flava JLT2011]
MKRTLLALSAITLLSCNDQVKTDASAQVSEEQNTADTTSTPVPDPIPAESNSDYSAEIVVDGLDIPWGMAFLPDGSMLITEKKGEIILFKDGKKTSIQGAPEVYDRGQGGLLDIELHPDYAENGWIYLTYSSKEGEGDGGNTALMRAKLNNGKLTGQEVLYKASPNTTKGQHFGSRIAFDKEGFLYFSAGERGERDVNPQDITRDNGKIYRLNDDGSIPQDNPFINDDSAKKAIFSYGHRNPQGMIMNPETGEIWVHEHGPQGGDEINVIKKAANYGWPVLTYGENYDGTPITEERTRPGMEDPIFYWLPSIAPSGFEFVTSEEFPDLKGNLLVGSLKFQYLELLRLDGKKIEKREKLLEDIGRVRNVKQGPDGNIYVAVEGKGIFKLKNNN